MSESHQFFNATTLSQPQHLSLGLLHFPASPLLSSGFCTGAREILLLGKSDAGFFLRETARMVPELPHYRVLCELHLPPKTSLISPLIPPTGCSLIADRWASPESDPLRWGSLRPDGGPSVQVWDPFCLTAIAYQWG